MEIIDQPIKKLKFNQKVKPKFYADVRKEVDSYFKTQNLSSNANAAMILKSLFFIVSFIGLYVLILAEVVSPGMNLILAVVLGMTQTFIAFNVSHDAIHGAYSSSGRINSLLSYTFNLVGLSSYMWGITHNKVHHTYTNIPDHDEDLEVAPDLIRLSPNVKMRSLMKYQRFYAFLLYGLASLFWVFVKDYKKMGQKKIGEIDTSKHPAREYVILFFTKAFYYTMFIALPLYFMNITVGQFLIGFVCYHLASGLVAGLVFQLAHVVEETTYSEPDEEWQMEESWALIQMQGTANFAMKSFLATFLCGGLNYQIEHHLFPLVCHIHYPEISKIVKNIADKHEVPYNFNTSFLDALKSHYRMLKKFGSVEAS